MRRPGHWLRRTLAPAVALTALSLAAPPAEAQQDTTLTELPMQVELERQLGELFLSLTRDSVVYLPVRGILDLAAVHVDTVVPGVRFAARFGRPVVIFGVDLARGEAFRGDERWPLAGRVVWRDTAFYASTDLLGELLGADFTVYWADLLVTVTRADALPAIAMRRREAERGAIFGRQSRAFTAPFLPVQRRLADGLVLDWSFISPTRDPDRNHTLQLGAGAAVLGGGLTIQHQANTTTLGTTRETHWSWQIGFPQEGRLVRQARAGEIGAGGPRSPSVRGAAVSNSPFLRPAEFGDLAFGGSLPPGWEVELRRGEELVGFTSADASGRWGAEIPVIYGPNPLDVVAYGPRGEIVRRSRTLAVPFERLPEGRFEYSVGGGECLSAQCDAAANVDVRYGVSPKLTVQGGYDRFWRDTLHDVDHPYALVAVSPHPLFGVQVEAVANGFARLRTDVDPSPDFHLDASRTNYSDAVTQPIIGSAFVRNITDVQFFLRPPLGGYTYLQGNATRVAGVLSTRTRGRFAATTRLLGARLLAAISLEREAADSQPALERSGVELAAEGVLRLGVPLLRGTYLRGALITECEGLRTGCHGAIRRVTAAVARNVGPSLRVDLAARHERGVRGLSVDLAITMARPWVRATSRNSYVPTGGVTGTQSLEGSVLWNRRDSRLELSSGRQLGRGGLVGIVFLDHNANGRRDDGEPGVPDVLLRVGSDAARTDSLGRFAVWELVPFTGTLVEVDTLGMPNPLWVPTHTAVLVPPGPNSYATVDIPIQEGAEVNGRVEMEGRPLGGARILFREIRTGRTRDVVSFGDGTYYMIGLPAGEYTVVPSTALMAQLQARAEPLTITIGGPGAQRRDDLVVRLVRARN